MTLADRVPSPAEPDAVLDAFTGWAAEQGLSLYPHQEEALLEVVSGSSVVLATPTGSGKSMVATGAQFWALAQGQRSFYTAPVKALVSEKFFALCGQFGAENVGMMTGDATVNGRAPVIACTAEILANLALREGADADVGLAVLDEFHYYADPDRGWAWQVPLLELTRTQLVLMSATLGDTTALRERLTARSGRETVLVASAERPVPLHPAYVTTPLHETLEELLGTRRAPVYVVFPTQAAAVEQAQALMSVNVCTREEKDRIAEAIGAFRFTKGFGGTLSRLVRHGIGVHHAGMLPKYRRLVEQLAQGGLLKVVCGTDTLGVGINVPIRTVLMTSLTKYDGVKVRHLKAREFHQVAGRAGRAGFDTAGDVVVQAPEHDVENARRIAKAGDDPKKLKRVERKKAPEGFVSWGQPTFERLWTAEPEPLTSSFRVSHAMLLQVVQRRGDFFAHMRRLLLDNDAPRAEQRRLVRQAIRVFKALEQSGTLERLPEPDVEGRTVRLTVELQPDFALDQPLSPFAVAALELLDRESPSYALDLVSVVEAVLEAPRQVLQAQRHKARGEAVAEMKAQGLEYEERMDLLEEISYPQPLAELLFAAFEAYREGSPWVADQQLTPKSVVRDMSEKAMTFVEYVGHYGLARSEGALLRYLSDAYKALRRTVPEALRTEEVEDLIAWLGEVVRQTDSSLLEEWEALQSGAVPDAVPVDVTPPRLTANERAFRVLVRNALFRRVELFARRRWIDLAELDPGVDWETPVRAYFEVHDTVGTGPDARGPQLFSVTDEGGTWRVLQTLDDPAGDRDWVVEAVVDLAASDEAGEAVLQVVFAGELKVGP